MRVLEGPGMPKWPKLQFDEKRGKAIVTAKAISWRRHLTGVDLARGLSVLVMIMGWVAFFAIGLNDPPKDSLAGMISTVAIVTLITMGIILSSQSSFIDYCAKRVKITFTKDAIWIGNTKHKRFYQGVPLEIGFRIIGDVEADKRLSTDRSLNLKDQHLIRSARIVEMVVQASDNPLSGGGWFGPGAVFQVAKLLGDQKAEEFSVVCMAAARLTARSRVEEKPPVPVVDNSFPSFEDEWV